MTLPQRLRHAVPLQVRSRLAPLPRWSVAVAHGPSPLQLGPAASPVIPLGQLDECGMALMADPFAIEQDGEWHLFTEVVPKGSRRGHIALTRSRDLVSWDHVGIVLSEPHHLSYPFVFAYDDEVWMVPESVALQQVRLYRARSFPHDWVLDRVLLAGADFKDTSLVEHDGKWFLFTETSSRHTNDVLRVFVGPGPHGPWTEHPHSPVVNGDPGAARPAGRPVVLDGKLLRFAQDCRSSYGRAVRAFEVDLSATSYAERLVADDVLPRSTNGPFSAAVHHVDAHRVDGGWIGFVDGHP